MKVNLVDTTFISQHAKNIFSVTLIEYLKDIKLQGSLFEDKGEPGVISSVYTEFFVDHTEPLEALEILKKWGWCLGELLDGHEYLIILPVLDIPEDVFA